MGDNDGVVLVLGFGLDTHKPGKTRAKQLFDGSTHAWARKLMKEESHNALKENPRNPKTNFKYCRPCFYRVTPVMLFSRPSHACFSLPKIQFYN